MYVLLTLSTRKTGCLNRKITNTAVIPVLKKLIAALLIAALPLAAENVNISFFISKQGSMIEENRALYESLPKLFSYLEGTALKKDDLSYSLSLLREIEYEGESVILNFTKNKDVFMRAMKSVLYSRPDIQRMEHCPLSSLADSSKNLNFSAEKNYFVVLSDSFSRKGYDVFARRQFIDNAKKYGIRLIVILASGVSVEEMREYRNISRHCASGSLLYRLRYNYPLTFSSEVEASFILEGKDNVFVYNKELHANWRYADIGLIKGNGNMSIDLSNTRYEDIEEQVWSRLKDIAQLSAPLHNATYLLSYYFAANF